ncbi:efflux transporter outer membrane subunit [Aquabacterium sp. A7-Y]|uniref:efflux transporter outer membrane subunit n=1 Tax=Aquabacterium sp. A7-Y TaxID=1349605 RepID=UPI00223D1B9D|nr:efflux transporter outer membrane subunit [Aquabacterium sp. A7-Y]MCW7537632.1 efflux transporter outer membrane subunit [Aquabacterium sp. A7-Y]
MSVSLSSRPTWRPRLGAVLLVALALAGCASYSGIEPQARAFSPEAAGLAGASAPVTASVRPQWWRDFQDPALDALIERALADHPGLVVAQARLQRASAATGLADAAGGLQVQGKAEATRQRYTENGMVPPPLAGSMATTATLQLGASWEIDFFGRHAAALQAALGAERAAQADVEAARVLLAANVARSYVQLARLLELREVSARALAQREELLGLIRQRVQAGLDTTVELRQGEGALPETRGQLEALDEQIALTRHALAALTAQPPAALATLQPRLGTVAEQPLPGSLPVDLLGRRPDVEAARWRVEAAGRDVAAAKAQFYPNVNLVAFAGLSSIGLDRLLESGSQQYGIGPAIHLPVFDSRRLRAGLRGKTAELDAAVGSYNSAVIDAVHEVADQLASAASVLRQQREQQAAAAAAESAYDLALQRYRAGLGSYLTVLSAETSVLAQRRQATDLKARALDSRIGLMRALGGGYTAEAAFAPHS